MVGRDRPGRLGLVDRRIARGHESVGQALHRFALRGRKLGERLSRLPGGADVRLRNAEVGRSRREQRLLPDDASVGPVRERRPRQDGQGCADGERRHEETREAFRRHCTSFRVLRLHSSSQQAGPKKGLRAG